MQILESAPLAPAMQLDRTSLTTDPVPTAAQSVYPLDRQDTTRTGLVAQRVAAIAEFGSRERTGGSGRPLPVQHGHRL